MYYRFSNFDAISEEHAVGMPTQRSPQWNAHLQQGRHGSILYQVPGLMLAKASLQVAIAAIAVRIHHVLEEMVTVMMI